MKLEEALKPPFFNKGERVYVGAKDDSIRGIAILQETFSTVDFGDQLHLQIADFVVSALNEKWERDYGSGSMSLRG